MPTGSNVAIHEDSDGGYSLYLGDLVHTDLTTRAAANCGADNDGCEDSIQDGLLNAGYDLQSRAVGLLLIAGGIILASFAHILIELYKDSQQVPQIVHITGPEVSSIKGAADDVTGVVLQTAANDAGVAVPITQVPTGPVSASAGTITSTINPSTITVTPVTLQTIAAGWELEFTSEGKEFMSASLLMLAPLLTLPRLQRISMAANSSETALHWIQKTANWRMCRLRGYSSNECASVGLDEPAYDRESAASSAACNGR